MTARTIQGRATFTTGQVARLCNVASRTVCHWIDAGHLPGYRLPGGKDRRVGREALAAFMRERMPFQLEEREQALAEGAVK